jgi:hypothetical protein
MRYYSFFLVLIFTLLIDVIHAGKTRRSRKMKTIIPTMHPKALSGKQNGMAKSVDVNKHQNTLAKQITTSINWSPNTNKHVSGKYT